MKKHVLLILSLAFILFSCKPDPVVPTVITLSVTEITENSAKSGGDVTSDGGAEVNERGICWSKNAKPTLNDFRTIDGSGIGLFNSNITELEDSTTYFVRAYAVNSAGTAYGNEISFTTLAEEDDDDEGSDEGGDENEILLPTISTLVIEDITENSAVSGGNVLSDGGAEVTARGVCWSTNQNPTVEESYTTDGEGSGEFMSNITDLNPNTTYYVRAYATNEKGTAYGEEMSFTTIEVIVIDLPEVKTVSVTDVTEYSAIVTGEVVSDGGAEVVERGFKWNYADLNEEENIEDNVVVVGSGLGTYTFQFTGLEHNKEYYVVAYAINSEGEAMGDYIYFTTMEEEEDNTINGYEYVDLGLPSGIKWATQNIGASSSTEIGDFYAWGETNVKDEYTEANCSTYGIHFDDISGDSQYDAATALWGATWRLPTKAEMEELRDVCVWEWIENDEMVGFKLTGPNGNNIYLPATGFILGTTPYFPEKYGYYWTSDPGTENDFGSFSLYFSSEGYDVAWYFRYAGLPIRPVSD